MGKFCNICNGRSFTTFNGRIDAMCRNCGSLERNRALELFLLFLPTEKERKICVLTEGKQMPRFCEHLSPLHGTLELLDVGQSFPKEKRYDIVLHDHLLHGTEEIWSINNYPEFVDRVEDLLKDGGVQAFSMGNYNEISRFFNESTLDDLYMQNLVFEPETFDEHPSPGGVMLFSPFRFFGELITNQAGLGYSVGRPLNGHSLLIRVKD